MNAFIEKIKDGAIETQKKYGVLASLTIAQAILETGWGKYSVGNNVFGIKASPSWTGGTVTCATGEVYDGQAVATSGTFRTYGSIAEAIEDHAKLFVNNSCYHNIIGCTDYKQACRNVQADGYATDPDYANKLISIIESNNLQQFDGAEAPAAPAAPVTPETSGTYTVKFGDTLSGIAAKLGFTVRELADFNGIQNPNYIQAGQVLRLPESTVPSTPTPTSSGNANIRTAQQFYNARGAGIAEDGIWGPATRKALIMSVQRGCNQAYGSSLVVDGILGPKTEAAIRTLRSGDDNAAVWSLQAALMAHGYSVGGIDGKFGGNTDSAVRAFQRDHGLTVDGLAGEKTFAALCK